MAVTEIERVITPYGELKVYVVATAGTHHSTIAAAVLKFTKALPQPDYVESITNTARAGKWCTPVYSGVWQRLAFRAADGQIRKTFTAWPIPAEAAGAAWPTVEGLTDSMKTQILNMIQFSDVPATVGSFEELQEYADGNTLSDDLFPAAPDMASAEAWEAFHNRCASLYGPAQAAIDAWLKAGRP